MATWAWIAGVYGVVLTIAALTMPIRRRAVAAAACLAFVLASLALGTLGRSFAVQFLIPGLLLLTGYWLSGFFFRDPQPWLEQLLLDSDARVFEQSGIHHRLRRAPAWIAEAFEASYAGDYLLIAAGAFVTAPAGIGAVHYYWSLVLGSEFICYGLLPWLRSRPPRAIEGGRYEYRGGLFRSLNTAILDRASVQANTLPSGHVAGAFAAALGVWPVSGEVGAIFLAIALLISIAAVVGRYHYAIDCLSGASVAFAVSSLL